MFIHFDSVTVECLVDVAEHGDASEDEYGERRGGIVEQHGAYTTKPQVSEPRAEPVPATVSESGLCIYNKSHSEASLVEMPPSGLYCCRKRLYLSDLHRPP